MSNRYDPSESNVAKRCKPAQGIPDPSQVLRLSSAPIAVRYLAAIVMTALATVIAVGLDTTVTIPNLSLVYVIPVVVAAVAFGLGPSLCSAVLGALAYNFFFTEPRYTLMVDDPANVWAIGLLFVVGCIASGVASVARRRADDVVLLIRQGTILSSILTMSSLPTMQGRSSPSRPPLLKRFSTFQLS